MRRPLPTTMLAIATTALLTALGATVTSQRPAAAASPAPAATAQEGASDGYVGSDTCAACHEDVALTHRVSVHARAAEPGPEGLDRGCESCHGPGAAHVDALGDPDLIFSFASPTRTVAAKVERCLGCHADGPATSAFRTGPHMTGALDCSACHKPHAAATLDRLLPHRGDPLRLGAGLESCLGCHQEVRAAVTLNERHRMLEGMVTCADCHQPHGPSARARLGGFKQETCIGCHTDKGGPFVFEHLSSRVDGCTSCHDPHGTVTRHMLTFQNQGDLCYSCHVEVPGFHGGGGPTPRFDSTTNCTNCHASIHGSNLDPQFLR